MTKYKLYSLFILIAGTFFFYSSVSGQFITIARKIKSKHTSQTDVATVTIEVKTYRVYQAVIDTLSSNTKFKINNRDNVKHLVEFTNGTNTVSIQVDSLANGSSQITVSSAHSDTSPKPTTDIAVDAIMAVCHKVGVKCTCDEK